LDSNQEKLREFEPVFYPKSIAVAGTSLSGSGFGAIYFRSLIDRAFRGEVYPVNPKGGSLFGLKVYPSLKSIPGPVDYVSVFVPRRLVLGLLDDCAAKGVKVVQFFTAGFSETGEAQWSKLEEEILKKAQQGGFRIIGPNCIGVYSPTINMPCGAEGILGEAGSIAFISQSGSLDLRVVLSGTACGLRFSNAVSLGNGIDLDSTDYLEYFAIDPKTKAIGVYIEGVKDGQRFLKLVKEISKRKPVIVWKGGRTEAGAKAATSHTAALASPSFLWTAALKQAGAIEVANLEEMIDTLLVFQQFPLLANYGITVISGLADGGGGQSVSAADTCASLGLEVSPFGDGVRRQLESLLGQVGSIFNNPLDVSQAKSNVEIIRRAIEIATADQHVDLVVIQESMDLLIRRLPWEAIERLGDMLADLCKRQGKPMAAVLLPGLAEVERLAWARKLSNERIAVFPAFERAAKAVANMKWYAEYRERILADHS
jgi:acyl-CoA synthetase (NDP forming)